jgi:hypothetical protein
MKSIGVVFVVREMDMSWTVYSVELVEEHGNPFLMDRTD